jgi:hypothetical protein
MNAMYRQVARFDLVELRGDFVDGFTGTRISPIDTDARTGSQRRSTRTRPACPQLIASETLKGRCARRGLSGFITER